MKISREYPSSGTTIDTVYLHAYVIAGSMDGRALGKAVEDNLIEKHFRRFALSSGNERDPEFEERVKRFYYNMKEGD